MCKNIPCSSCSPRQGRCCHLKQRSPGRCGPPGWVSAGCSTGQLSGRNTPPALRLDGRNLCERGGKISENVSTSVYHMQLICPVIVGSGCSNKPFDFNGLFFLFFRRVGPGWKKGEVTYLCAPIRI